jgi:hypothetical protein
MCKKWTHTGLAVSVCPSVHLYNSTREPLDGFGRNLVQTSCHYSVLLNCTFHFPVVGYTNMADKRTFQVGLTLAPLTVGPNNDASANWIYHLYLRYPAFWIGESLYAIWEGPEYCLKTHASKNILQPETWKNPIVSECNGIYQWFSLMFRICIELLKCSFNSASVSVMSTWLT